MAKTKRRADARKQSAPPPSSPRDQHAEKKRRAATPSVSPAIGVLAEMRRDPVWMIATTWFAVIAIATLAKNGLWHDEWLKQHEFSAGTRLTAGGHPLHYAIGMAWAGIAGVGPFALRLPWALFAIACVPLGYALGFRMDGRPLARTLCILLAFSPYLLLYAQDANYYAEMMFYSLAAAVALVSFLDSGKLWFVLVALACLALLYLVHPFGAVFGGAILAGAVIASIFESRARESVLHFVNPRAQPPWMLGIKVAVAFALFFFVFKSGLPARVLQQASQFFGQFNLGGSYTNVAFNLKFFSQTLSEFGPAIVQPSIASMVLGWTYAAVASAGTVYLFRRRPWASLMFALVFVAAGVVIFCFKIDRFFHVRYISFLVPLYLLGVAAGLVWIGRAIESRLGARGRHAWSLPLAALLVCASPFYLRQLTFDGGYLKKIAAYFDENLTPGDRVITYEMAGDFMPIKPPGVPPDQHVQMPYLPRLNQGWLNDGFTKQMLFKRPETWLLHHWNDPRTIHPPLLDWADEWMTRVVEAPSIYETGSIQRYNEDERFRLPVMMGILYRWDWPDRYVIPASALVVDLANESSRPRWELKRELGLAEMITENGKALWRSPFLFEKLGRYRIDLVPPRGIDAKDYELQIDEKKIAPLISDDANKQSFSAEISAGRVEFQISTSAQTGGESASSLPTLMIMPDVLNGFTIDPFFFEPPGPQNQFVHGEVVDGEPRLIMKRNMAASYRVHAPETARYNFAFKVVADKPGPIAFDLLVDREPAGIFVVTDASGRWTTASAQLKLAEGEHELSVAFLTERDVMAKNPDQDNDLVLGGIAIRRAQEGDRDDRFPLEGKLAKAPFAPNFADIETADRLSGGWQFAGDARLSTEDDAIGGHIVTMDLVRESRGAQLVMPPVRVEPNQFLYFDLDARTDSMSWLSANVRVDFYDAQQRPVGSLWSRATDINTPTDWQRYAHFSAVPENAALASIRMMVYKNSRTTTPELARFEFRRFRIIESSGIPEPSAPAPQP